MARSSIALSLVMMLLSPLAGCLAAPGSTAQFRPIDPDGVQLAENGHSENIPVQSDIWWDTEQYWWQNSSLDRDGNGIHDSLQSAEGPVNVGLSFSRKVTQLDHENLESLGFEINLELPIVDALLLGDVNPTQVWILAQQDGVVMVERYGSLIFYVDVHTPSVKARNSTE